MVSTGMFIYKEDGQRTKYSYIIIHLFIAFLAFNGCSKSPNDDVTVLSDQELNILNHKLKDYMFMTRYFDDQDRIWAFLQELASMHYDQNSLVASGGTVWSVRRNEISSWLRAEEKSEAVFRKLCPDPVLTFEANKWKGVFNVFKKDGSVDKWQVVGEHYPEKRYNQVENVKISNLKPEGTFFWPFLG